MTETRPAISVLGLSLSLGFGLGLGAGTATAQAHPNQKQQPKHLLRYAFQKGTTRYYRIANDVATSVKMGAQTMEMSARSQMFMKFVVAEVARGKATIEHTCTRIVMQMNNSMTGEVTFDSDDENAVAGPFDQVLAMIGQPISVAIDHRGRPSDAELPPTVAQAMAAAGMDMEQTVNQMMAQLPETPVAIGDTWMTSFQQPMGALGEITIDCVNKLIAVAGVQATIEQDMKLDLDAAAAPIKAKPMVAKTTMVLDLSEGLPIRMNMQMEMVLTEPMAMDMKMTMAFERTTPPTTPPTPAPHKRRNKIGGKSAGATKQGGGG